MRALLTILVLVSVVGCSGPPSPTPAPGGRQLSFSVRGVEGLGDETFHPRPAATEGHWVFDPKTERTTIRVAGATEPWRISIDLVLPLDGDGTYHADPSHRGIDRAFVLALMNEETGRRISLVATEASVVLARDPSATDWLVGRFSGRFAVGARTTGRDILSQPAEERRYADVRDGRFHVAFEDTMHGAGSRWPASPTP